MAVKVIVPNKGYNGKFHEQFKNGEAIFENESLARDIAKRFGYQIEELEKPKAEPKKKAPAKRKAPAKKVAE